MARYYFLDFNVMFADIEIGREGFFLVYSIASEWVFSTPFLGEFVHIITLRCGYLSRRVN
jgi:hypothetical protein